MTINEFLDEVRKLDGWAWTNINGSPGTAASGQIRFQGNRFCPITRIAMERGKEFAVNEFDLAAEFLGLSNEDMWAIVGGADGAPWYPSTRQQLAKACKLA